MNLRDEIVALERIALEEALEAHRRQRRRGRAPARRGRPRRRARSRRHRRAMMRRLGLVTADGGCRSSQ